MIRSAMLSSSTFFGHDSLGSALRGEQQVRRGIRGHCETFPSGPGYRPGCWIAQRAGRRERDTIWAGESTFIVFRSKIRSMIGPRDSAGTEQQQQLRRQRFIVALALALWGGENPDLVPMGLHAKAFLEAVVSKRIATVDGAT